MDPFHQYQLLSRRQLLMRGSLGLGATALASLLQPNLLAAPTSGASEQARTGALPHFAPKAKRVIYLVQSGAPSQMDLFDYKPMLDKLHKTELPESIRQGQRLTTMTSGQKSFPIARSIFKFAQHGNSGAWLSELLPHTAKVADELCFIKSMYTEAINHDPAITMLQTGSQQAGRPSFGAWLSYGLGTENSDLPAYAVFTSVGSGRPDDQPVYDRLWGAGFLPSKHQGVRFRSAGDPVLYLSNPAGVSRETRRDALDDLAQLNQLHFDAEGDPEILTRIAQYELAFRMQTSVPELLDISQESKETLEMYGPEVTKPGTYAANCLLARRLSEKGVRFVQLFHRGWDQHGSLPTQIKGQCRDTDQPSAALIQDLKQRGLLDDTLVIWGGEFGRTVYSQGTLTENNYGRDHHPRCFTIWLAGGGIKPGISIGQTDDYGYNIVGKGVHIHDLNATLMHCLGIDHTRLTHRFQGRDFRLTDVHGEVVKEILV